MLTDLTLLEARCDWLTVSARHNPELGGLMGLAGVNILEEQKRGERLKTARPHGWDLARAGHWTLATGKLGAYVSVEGEDAQRWGQALLAYSDKCTRIDYCVTVQSTNGLETPIPEILTRLDERYGNDRLAEAIQHYRGLRHDRGLSIGKRGAPYHGRVYDKSIQSRGIYPRGTWRYEIELRRHAAAFERGEYHERPGRFGEAGNIVGTHFRRWGIDVPGGAFETVETAIQIRQPTDADRAIRWLERQVRPTVQWLMEIGRGDEAYRVLFEQLAIPGLD